MNGIAMAVLQIYFLWNWRCELSEPLIVFSRRSSGTCSFLGLIEAPLTNIVPRKPAAATLQSDLRFKLDNLGRRGRG